MSIDVLAIVCLGLISLAVLIGIFRTKTPGFGRYTTSLVLLVTVLFVAALLLATGKLDSTVFANVIFAIAGFAGGLITTKSDNNAS